MKPEPLKGKCCVTRAGNPIHMDYDIKSAVEWLKGNIDFIDSVIDPLVVKVLIKVIDEAFEDVMK